MRLSGKTAIVTGGAQGIGRVIAETFAREGATVIAVDMTKPDYTCEGVFGYTCNVTDREGLKAFVEDIVGTFGKVDVLINNAGITRDGLLQKMTEEMWDLVCDVNLKGVFNLTQLVGPLMIDQGTGSIVNISSVVGEYGNVGQTNYAATKAGVIAMAKSWAKEFARKGANVRVNSLAPGYINTEMMKTVPDKVLDPIRRKTMLGRLGEPEEIAKACLFLASDEASFITGHCLSVNGGLRL
ncbi:3-oxoacyl-ACP reductase FabG [Desulfoluna spongiiphila]|uniref:3-oxoacyl-[acyl-carrier-protein] reductase n=1 Tax=Desulfoluna spongiiphila TaxID=419481 RepID=A0A1G5ISH1_9BACT|nr:3-oxoacyl-ACP reductase FabG [Desulfoluna spongiiphila]SCY78844.1 3-oxoacyl-[acyl-carrier-protein] reductase [Desulfoluna spongiiphila]VVS92514.1 enoyl-(acyl carrier protein) reductase [Desulfoluna spongiiphila]